MTVDTPEKGMKKGRGVIILLYAAVCAMLVLLVIMFRLAGARDHRDRSDAFNVLITGIFARQGIRDARDVLAAEKRSAGRRWREYSRSVQVPETVDRVTLIIQLRETAALLGLDLTVSGSGADAFTARAGTGGMLFSSVEAVVAHEPRTAPKKAKKLAIVIDDIGYTRDISAFLELGIPITFAILPHEPYSKDIARELAEKRIPYILHLPLEPERYPAVDPGKAALLLSMPDAEGRRRFESDVEAVPGICGVSNHMGSAYSESEPKMRFLMGLLKERGLFYFDSYTTPRSRASAAAREAGLPFAENSLFLDLQDDPAFMKKQCELLLKRVRRTGRGIAIAHIQKKHIVPALAEAIPGFKKEGIEFVYLKDLVQVLPPAPAGTLVRKTATHEHTRH